METQQDNPVRLVALVNLQGMCEHVSGTCHKFRVAKVTRSTVHVEYSNPDEYGNDCPITAVFPCFPSHWPDDKENPRVMLDISRTYGGRPLDRDDGWQAFEQLRMCPILWRDPQTGTWKPNTTEVKP